MARFRPRKTFEKELRGQPEFQAALATAAVVVAASVRMAALPYRNTGYFISHVKARRNRVLFLDAFWHLAEYGSVHNAPQRNAFRGVRAAGLRFVDDGLKQADSA